MYYDEQVYVILLSLSEWYLRRCSVDSDSVHIKLPVNKTVTHCLVTKGVKRYRSIKKISSTCATDVSFFHVIQFIRVSNRVLRKVYIDIYWFCLLVTD